ncbi:hypothetical protein [Mesoplasma florum]|uniref:hypothetical protein n=1 Tax=Mesoplasma florum TaxID=2151 RepID=UPI000D090776|nr:hypothetical protein [Mesoplasma florum]AVN61020.1 hypothetical protein CG005_01795 [Mesoplasma florum]
MIEFNNTKKYFKVMIKRLVIFDILCFIYWMPGLVLLILSVLYDESNFVKKHEWFIIFNYFTTIFCFVISFWLFFYILIVLSLIKNNEISDNEKYLSIFALFLNHKNFKRVFISKNKQFSNYVKIFWKKDDSKKMNTKKHGFLYIIGDILFELFTFSGIGLLLLILFFILFYPIFLIIYVLVYVFSLDINIKINKELNKQLIENKKI